MEQDSLPGQQTRKIDAAIICAFVFFYPPINPFFLLLFSAFVLLTYW
ncbi:Uncharacterised protein [Shigella sonnei]|nr:Uncharacterised protein [Shigella sonnei]